MATRDPYEVRLSDERRTELVDELTREVYDAIDARTELDERAKYYMRLYEQDRTRLGKNAPWPDAADLTSYIGTEKVDAIVSRISRTIFTEPIWSVEGWGEAQSRSAWVEEFHQWKAEEERLQGQVERALRLSFIDPLGVLEVYEDSQTRMVQDTKVVAPMRDPITGAPVLDETGQAVPQRDPETGRLVEVEPDDPAGSMTLEVDAAERVRVGPAYKVIPFRDFYMMPGHARDRSEVWAYAKRFWRRKGEIEQMATRGVYRQAAVDQMTDSGERQGGMYGDTQDMDERTHVVVSDRQGALAEKELWEVLFLKDLDGKGERWYLATVHLRDRLLLRLQKDDLNAKRFVLFTPDPRSDSVYGYSIIEKLLTLIEEHTAWRNMNADKAAMGLMGPIKRLANAMWQPDEQPLGPKAVITVRDMNEIDVMQLPDLPRGAVEREREVLQGSERVAGVNDVALGVTPQTDRTLGEVQLVASQSAVRMELMTKHIQESMEDLFQIRHRIWVRTLADMDARGESQQTPSSMLTGLENRGVETPGDTSITAAMLEGAFRGKPHGSVETADPAIMRQDFVQMMQMLPQMLQANPALQMAFNNPEAARALLSEFLRVFRMENRSAFLAGLNQAMLQQAQPMGAGQPEQRQPEQGGAPDLSALTGPSA